MEKRTFLKKSLAVAGAAAASGTIGSLAAQEPIKLRISHFLSPASHHHTKLFQPWAQRIEKDSGGRIKCEIFPSMQIGGKPPQSYDLARTGVADIAWALPGYTPGRFPISGVFELPFMTAKTAEATSRAIWDFYNEHLKEEFKDVHLLTTLCHAPGLVHTKDRPVTKMEDLHGMKIRLPTKPVGDALKLMGAIPVGMPLTEAYEALSRSVAEGVTLPWEAMRSLRLFELVKYHTTTDLYTTVFTIVMNKHKYESLPAELQAVIDKNTDSNFVSETGRMFDDAESQGLQQAKELGHGIGELSEAEKARWKQVTRPVVDAWIQSTPNGRALYDEANRLIAKYSG
ncbi:MAG: TRAP transporter substrate-binding protein [Burkholderiaceae bacterium]|nr:TRAP transporter substrate-binding protein [Burkholderiaceae bacterium]